MVIKEAVRVTEAFILSSISDSYNFLPDFVRILIPNGDASGPLVMPSAERGSLVELRDQVLRVWRLLQSSNDFDPSLLLPIVQVKVIICLTISIWFHIRLPIISHYSIIKFV